MKKLIAILLLALMFLQAIPVLHFFSSQKEIFYSYIDEDKTPETKVTKEKMDGKEMFLMQDFALPLAIEQKTFLSLTTPVHPSPLLRSLIQPPDATC